MQLQGAVGDVRRATIRVCCAGQNERAVGAQGARIDVDPAGAGNRTAEGARLQALVKQRGRRRGEVDRTEALQDGGVVDLERPARGDAQRTSTSSVPLPLTSNVEFVWLTIGVVIVAVEGEVSVELRLINVPDEGI